MTISAELIEHFHLLGDAPETVQQLRKIIVALAIRGRLANEGKPAIDASSLRDEIQKRRHALTVGGELRRKEHPEVAAEDLPADFLDTSRFIRLGFVANVEKGVTGIQSAKQGPYPLVVTAADRATCDHFDFEGAAAIVPLVSSAGHGKASLNRLHYQEGKFALGSILAAVFPLAPDLISARFLFEYLTAFKEELLVSRMSGTANVTLTVGRLCDVPVPLIAPATQKRIDELMALCDQLEVARNEREARRDQLVAASLHRIGTASTALEARATGAPSAIRLRDAARFHLDHLPRLTTRPEHIKQLRQAILNLAVRGSLVPQDPEDEPATALMKKIQAEKATLVKAGKLKKDKSIWDGLPKEPPYEIPINWAWVRLQDTFEISRGGSPRPAGDPLYFGGSIPWITVREITKDDGKFLTTTEGGLTDLGATKSRFIDPGDLLLTNSGATLGVPKISQIRGCMNDGVAVLRQFHSVSLNDFAYLYLQSQTAIFRQINQGMGQPNLNTPIIAGWFFPLPPLAEQHRIVAKVDELMALCDQLEAQLSTTQTDSRRLLEAVLHEALAA